MSPGRQAPEDPAMTLGRPLVRVWSAGPECGPIAENESGRPPRAGRRHLAWERAGPHNSPETERRSSPYLRQARTGVLMTQDRWWLAISIVWLFLMLGVLLYVGFA